MKKTVRLFLCAILLGNLLVGCGKENTDNTQPTNNSEVASDTPHFQNPLEIEEYQLEMNGIIIAMNMEMAEILDKMGEPTKYFESDSCGFQGKDKVYTYGSIVIKTYPKNDVDYVYNVELKDRTVATRENLKIGDSKEAVLAIYGEPTKSTDYAMKYRKKDCELVFIIEDGKRVSSIVYNAIVE